MPDQCYFCGGPDAAYSKKDRAGVWRDACYFCCTPKRSKTEPEKPAQEPAHAEETLFTELD